VNQVSVSGVDLDDLEARLARSARRVAEGVDDDPNAIVVESVGNR
jgi:hypothetical protein